MQNRLLEQFEKTGQLLHSLDTCKVPRTSHYDWLKTDPVYAERFANAKQRICDIMEEEAKRRAIQGTKKPVFHKGEIVGHINEYSDLLLIFLMKANMPEKYRERLEHSHSGPGGGPIQTQSKVTIVEDNDWYGNQSRLPTETVAASNSSLN